MGLDSKWLGIKTLFSKKYRKFEKNNYAGQISITGPDLDPENIDKFDDQFGRQKNLGMKPESRQPDFFGCDFIQVIHILFP